MKDKDGNHKLIEQLLCDGLDYMFGNPGTVEEGFLDAISDYKDFHYITCLQESICVAAADGYARRSGKCGVVQLHSSVGLGNGIGMLYQALRGNAPLLVIAGEAGIQYDAMDAQMACDLVAMAKPVTKWAQRVIDPASLLRMVRRAVKIAMTPPQGPVFLALPLDILDQINSEIVRPSVTIHNESIPSDFICEELAEKLCKAHRPICIMGDGVSQSSAAKELENVCVKIGARVYGANHSQFNFDETNPLYQGNLGHMFGTSSKAVVKDADVVLIVATYVFPEVFPSLEEVFDENAYIAHIDLDAYEIGKNHRVDLGIWANPKVALKKVYEYVEACQTKEQEDEAAERIKQLPAKAIGGNECLFHSFARELSDKLDENYIIFEEALTSAPYLEQYFPKTKPGRYFQTRGGSLGIAIPGALGAKLADYSSHVIAVAGDGGAMYTIQVLQSLVRYQIPVKIVICQNGGYQLLKNNIDVYWKEKQETVKEYPDCFTIEPAVDYLKIAESMGIVDGMYVTKEEQIKKAVSDMLACEDSYMLVINT